jgi:hypothetical protein
MRVMAKGYGVEIRYLHTRIVDLTAAVCMTPCIWHYRLACISCTASQSPPLDERHCHRPLHCGVMSTLILQYKTAEEQELHSEIFVGLHQRPRN